MMTNREESETSVLERDKNNFIPTFAARASGYLLAPMSIPHVKCCLHPKRLVLQRYTLQKGLTRSER